MNHRKAFLVGGGLVAFWVVILCYFVHYSDTAQQQLILLGGFGAMLTGFAWNRLARLLRLKNLELNRDEFVIVYAMLLCAIPLCVLFRGAIESGLRNVHPEMAGRLTYSYIKNHPWMSVQSKEAVEGYYYGPEGSPGFFGALFGIVPWSEWLRPILYWGVTIASFQLAALCLILILRKKWIDEDRLAYPWATIPAELAAERERPADAQKSRTLTLAFIVGLGICIPGLVGTVFEQFQAPVGVPPDVNGFGRDLTALELIPGVELRVILEPFVILALLLLPLDVTFSIFVTFCGLQIVLPWLLETAFEMPGYAGKISHYVMYTGIRWGGLVGLALWSLWFARRHIAGVLLRAKCLKPLSAAALGLGGAGFIVGTAGAAAGAFTEWMRIILPERPEGGAYAGAVDRFLDGLMQSMPDRTGALAWADWRVFMVAGAGGAVIAYILLEYPLQEAWNDWLTRRSLRPADEEGEPASYTAAVLGLLVSGIAFVVLMGLGQTWDLAFLALAIIFVANFTYGRIRAGGALPIYPPWHMMKSLAHMQQNYLGGVWSSEPAWNSAVKVGEFGVAARCLGPQTQLMEAFKLASETNTKGRVVLKAVLLSMAIVFLLTAPVFLGFAYEYGVNRTSVEGSSSWQTWSWWAYYADNFGTRETPNTFADMDFVLWILIGVGVVGLIMYLRREYVWFPLSPIGCFLGAVIGGYSRLGARYVWASVLVAFLVKYTIFKWYGVKTFRKSVLPYVIYAIMGLLTGMILYLIVWAFRGEGVWL